MLRHPESLADHHYFEGTGNKQIESLLERNISNASDRALLTQRIDSAAVVARGFKAPYAGFPNSNTLAQALRPYPQFSGALTAYRNALGSSWYDSLQMKLTKRYSHGLDLTAAFTYQRDFDRTTSFNDAFNRVNQKRIAASSQPFVFVTGFNYEVQKWSRRFTSSKLIENATSGWTLGGLLRYTSGLPINIPASANNLNNQIFQSTLQNRVPGEPLYLTDPNCHCIDPNKTLTLNPKAWTDAAPGAWGTSNQTFNDYRGQRFPDEQLSIGRAFRIRENKLLSIRAEFFNVFNRTVLAAAASTSPTATVTRDAQGNLTGGFGYINPASTGQPRNGQLVARFQW